MTAPIVAVGIGNTSVKVGVTAGVDGEWPNWTTRQEIPTASFDAQQLAAILPSESVRWCIASVQRSVESNLRDWVRLNRDQDSYRLLTFHELPIEIRVDAPERVGPDRLAAAVAANRLRHGNPAVVIDAGTAITVNLIGANGAFEGGVILPGFTLTAKALAGGTDLLPLVTADLNSDPPDVLGKSTEAAIRSGLFWGNVGAVREIVARLTAKLNVTPQIIVTGGDARRLAGFVSQDAKFVPDLVLAGIVFSVIRPT